MLAGRHAGGPSYRRPTAARLPPACWCFPPGEARCAADRGEHEAAFDQSSPRPGLGTMRSQASTGGPWAFVPPRSTLGPQGLFVRHRRRRVTLLRTCSDIPR
jgi:hypothetical protein